MTSREGQVGEDVGEQNEQSVVKAASEAGKATDADRREVLSSSDSESSQDAPQLKASCSPLGADSTHVDSQRAEEVGHEALGDAAEAPPLVRSRSRSASPMAQGEPDPGPKRGPHVLRQSGRRLRDSDLVRFAREKGSGYDEIDFSRNDLTSKSVPDIVEICKKSHQLKILKLFNNRLGDDGAEELGEIFQHCASIEEIHLSHNDFTRKGVEILVLAADRGLPKDVKRPLWLRMEHNKVSDTEGFARDLERDCPAVCGREDRLPKAGGEGKRAGVQAKAKARCAARGETHGEGPTELRCAVGVGRRRVAAEAPGGDQGCLRGRSRRAACVCKVCQGEAAEGGGLPALEKDCHNPHLAGLFTGGESESACHPGCPDHNMRPVTSRNRPQAPPLAHAVPRRVPAYTRQFDMLDKQPGQGRVASIQQKTLACLLAELRCKHRLGPGPSAESEPNRVSSRDALPHFQDRNGEDILEASLKSKFCDQKLKGCEEKLISWSKNRRTRSSMASVTPLPVRILAMLPYFLPVLDALRFFGAGLASEHLPSYYLACTSVLSAIPQDFRELLDVGQPLLLFAMPTIAVRRQLPELLRFNLNQAFLLDLATCIAFHLSSFARWMTLQSESAFYVPTAAEPPLMPFSNVVLLLLSACTIYSMCCTLSGTTPEGIPYLSAEARRSLGTSAAAMKRRMTKSGR
ncbi:unnamed protein product [Symbiodinium sp. CCMP2592]|nr:unnamed protein product [Symbiodinium sp. CCMP2592]